MDTETAPATHVVRGLVEMQWELLHEGVSRESGNRGGVCGTLRYSVNRCVCLADTTRLPVAFDPRESVSGLHVIAAIGGAVLEGGEKVASFLKRERAKIEHEALVCSVEEDAVLRSAAVPGHRFRDVLVYRRWADPSSFIGNIPKKAVLKRFRKLASSRDENVLSSDDDDAPPPLIEDALLYIPPDRAEQGEVPRRGRRVGGAPIDPVRLVHALSVVSHLRSPKLFIVALDDTHEYLFQDHQEVEPRRNEQDPRRSVLQKSLARADFVSMSVTRRMFQKWRKDDAVVAINVYSDASPVVGVELQGMLIDVVLKDGETIRLILPGSTLAYGRTDAISKGVALLWAIFLVAGPTADDIGWFCDNVRSFTTDFGVEMHLLDLPDVAEAMVAWAGGRPLYLCVPMVKANSRQFKYALRVAGWSHTLGGIMKKIAEGMDEWPQSLGKMRALVKFYKNGTYRSHIRRKLKLAPELDQTLKNFTASFAKWRYETVAEVLMQLLNVREVSELPLPTELFAKPQDPDEMATVMAACRDKPFWRWASANYKKIFRDLELLRRWGMVCECPAHRAARKASGGKKFIKCLRTYSVCYSLVSSIKNTCCFRVF